MTKFEPWRCCSARRCKTCKRSLLLVFFCTAKQTCLNISTESLVQPSLSSVSCVVCSPTAAANGARQPCTGSEDFTATLFARVRDWGLALLAAIRGFESGQIGKRRLEHYQTHVEGKHSLCPRVQSSPWAFHRARGLFVQILLLLCKEKKKNSIASKRH